MNIQENLEKLYKWCSITNPNIHQIKRVNLRYDGIIILTVYYSDVRYIKEFNFSPINIESLYPFLVEYYNLKEKNND